MTSTTLQQEEPSRPTDARRERFSTVAIVLHWTIAALILTNLYLGLSMGAAHGMARFQVFQLHKSVGITILLLSLCRLGWRLMHKPPPYPDDMGRWERLAAGALHWIFYVIMIGMPLTGWVIVSASRTNIPTLLFKTVPWPHLGFVHALPMALRKVVEDDVGRIHGLIGLLTILLVALHVAAALKHQFWNRDGVLYRMVPFSPRRGADA